MEPLNQLVLRTEISGMPLEWIGFQIAAKLYYQGQVAYSLGNHLYTIHGGINAKTGKRSQLEVNSILATHGHTYSSKKCRDFVPSLNNHTLFKRDNHICLYCGEHFSHGALSRDHITPISLGGKDEWNNVATACKHCNNYKAGRSPEQAKMQLIAIPFAPTRAEYIYLQGRKVLSDQMEFLCAHFPRHSPLRLRLKA